MRNRVVIAEQQMNYATSSATTAAVPHFLQPAMYDSNRLQSSIGNERTKVISFADEPSLSARLHVAPYSPVRGGNSSAGAHVYDSALNDGNRSEKMDNVSLSELADVFNSHDEAALLSSLFFAKAQQPSASTHHHQQSPAHPTKSPSALKAVS